MQIERVILAETSGPDRNIGVLIGEVDGPGSEKMRHASIFGELPGTGSTIYPPFAVVLPGTGSTIYPPFAVVPF